MIFDTTKKSERSKVLTMELVAYNKDDVRARNLLAQAGEDNVLVEKNIHCTAQIEITSAYFDDEYKGARCLRRPYMKMVGTVNSVFIEDDDDRVFPCGTKSMTLMTPQQVSINYVLDESEISELALKGLFRENFEVPENLIGNVMEIPLSINYEGIYDTPCCIVEIEHPYELSTSSKENSYYGIFNGCRIHDEILREQQEDGYSANHNEEYLDDYDYDNTEEEYEDYEEQEALAEELAPELTDEEMEDQAIMDKLSTSLQDQIALSSNKKKNDNFDAREFMKELREEVEAEDKQEESEDIFGLFDEDNSTNKKDKKKKKRDSYEQIKRKMTRNVDVAADNKALNEGITDIAGMGAAEAPVKKSQPQNADNQANLAQQLLSGTFGASSPQNSSQDENEGQFL